MRPRWRAFVWLAAIAGCAGPAVASEAQRSQLAPYQMVRSLQLVQDRIANGDHAALPMQRKLLELIDQRLRDAEPVLFADRRNLRGLLVYAMSGGNPATFARVVSRIHLEERDRLAATAILDYLRGNPGGARRGFSALDPSAAEPELGAFLALIKGSLAALDDSRPALAHLDLARLLAPGTLVEEAALRRTITLAAHLQDKTRFLRASDQYARRFLRSPYAGQFAEAFVAGVVAFAPAVSGEEIDAIAHHMNLDQQRATYLRIARFAAIDGHKELSSFASGKATALGEEKDDPRAALYSSMSSITSDTVEKVLGELRAIDRGKLSANDRRLLEAAETIAAGVLATPERASAAPEPSSRPAIAPDMRESAPVLPAGPAASPDANARAATGDDAVPGDATDRKIDDTRRRIEAIDALLKDADT